MTICELAEDCLKYGILEAEAEGYRIKLHPGAIEAAMVEKLQAKQVKADVPLTPLPPPNSEDIFNEKTDYLALAAERN